MNAKSLIQSITPALETYQAIQEDLKRQGVDTETLPAVLALYQALLGRPLGEDPALGDLFSPPPAPIDPHYRGVPFAKITAAWHFDGDTAYERAYELDRLARRLIGQWEFKEYYVAGYRREFRYRVAFDDDEIATMADDSSGQVKLVYRDREHAFLTLECDLFRPEPLLVSATCFHPDFIQGVHEIETDFFSADRDRLVAVLDHLQGAFPDRRKFDAADVALEQMGDRYTVCFFDD